MHKQSAQAATLVETIIEAAPRRADAAGMRLVTGHVLACDEAGQVVTLAVEGERLDAAVAVSCLIRPIVDDRVLLARGEAGAFVLSIVERDAPNYGTLALPGHGNLAIEGETLSLTARQRLALKGDSLDLQARTLAFIADKTTWLGKALTAIVERWHVSAKTQEVSADTLTVKAVNRVTIVDQVDTLRAQTQSIKIAGVVSETAQSKVIAVTDDLRMDGKRITMG
jgi:hypothetical protein